MEFSFRCPHCSSKIKTREDKRGRRALCPSCRKRIVVPNVQSAEVENNEPSDQGYFPVTSSRKSDTSAQKNTAKKPRNRSSAGEEPINAAPVQRRRKRRRRRDPTEQHRVEFSRALPAHQQKIRDAVMSGFSGPIERVPTTFLYRIGILLTAAFAVLMPVLYVVLIALAAYAVYWHATENVAIVSAGHGRARFYAVMLYIAPIVAGAIVVLFMLKPLFARPAQQGRTISLNRKAQPLLFEFVDRICDTVDAPRPARINVIFDVNAAAGFSGEMPGLLRSDFELTIGSPLVAGTTLQQFAGILAHEFGHFSQGTGMRVCSVIRNINLWFAQVVYTRDSWDQWLIETSEALDIRVGFIFYFARFAVFVNRCVLWCLMMVSHATTCWMSRQMEFDADRYEARLAGSDNFRQTCYRLHLLNYAMLDFLHQLPRYAASAENTGNLVRDFVRHCDALPDAQKQRVKRSVEKAKTGWFDTHPADPERISSAARENAAGVFHSNLPAEVVFRNFDKLCTRFLQA